MSDWGCDHWPLALGLIADMFVCIDQFKSYQKYIFACIQPK